MTSEAVGQWPDSPYKGLGYYTEADAPLFAGRAEDVVFCARILADWKTRLLLLHGATGCGKSSFLRAGLIPYLENRKAGIAFARAGPAATTPVLSIPSTGEPLAKLADALFRFSRRTMIVPTVEGPREVDLRVALPDPKEEDPAAFVRASTGGSTVLQLLKNLSSLVPKTLVLIIDQGEEILTIDSTKSGDKAREQFFEFLSDFGEAQFDVKLMIALRTEYLGRFAARLRHGFRSPGIADLFLGDLSEAQIRESIERPTLRTIRAPLRPPFDRYRFEFEPIVIDTMIEQLKQVAGTKLPALQIVCSALYDLVSKRPEPRKITLRDLDGVGGVEGSIESFLNTQLYDCGSAANLMTGASDREVVRWKEALHGLARPQPDGTVTTDLKPVEIIRAELEGTRFDFDGTIEHLVATGILRRVNVVDVNAGGLINCLALGHDTLGLALRKWKVHHDRLASSAPVQFELDDEEPEIRESDIALCLSGAGYRSVLFNLGALWRLNELAYLPRIARISCVSGGAIVGAMLGVQWTRLEFRDGIAQKFRERVVEPLRELTGQTIDAKSILAGILLPLTSAADKLAEHFATWLYGKATLQDLPDVPVIVLSATNLQCASLFRFSKSYLADYHLGRIDRPEFDLARAVAASAALPPMLSPITLQFEKSLWDTRGATQPDEFREKVYLADGTLYDHLGLEVAWRRHRTLLVSDPGGVAGPQAVPKTDWAQQFGRIIDVLDHQLRILRHRQLVEAFISGQKLGTYWSIRSRIEDFGLADGLSVDSAHVVQLSEIPSRYGKLSPEIEERLINWGYAICDAAMRKHMGEGQAAPAAFPFARGV